MKKRILKLLPLFLALILGVVLFACAPQETAYSVTYNAGEGIGDPISGEPHYKGDTFELIENTFTNGNKEFAGWNDGDNTYQPGATYTMPGRHVTFTAQWTGTGEVPPATYTVKFTSGVQSGVEGTAPNDRQYGAGEKFQLPACTFTRDRYKFAGWKVSGSDDETVYLASQNFEMPAANVTFEATWVQTYEVAFAKGADNAIGTDIPSQYYAAGESVTLPDCTYTRSGYTFAGWKIDSSDTIYVPRSTYTMGTGSVLFTAQWDIDVRVEGYWKSGKVTAESNVYDIMIKEADSGVYMLVLKGANGSDKRELTQPKFLAETDEDYTYSFKNGSKTITLTISAEETSTGGIKNSLKLSDGTKTMESTTVEDYDETTQLQMPQGTYSYLKYNKDAKLNAQVYSVTFGDEPAYEIEGFSGGTFNKDAPEGEQYSGYTKTTTKYTNVNAVIFDKYLAVFGSTRNEKNVCQLVFEHDGMNYKLIDGPVDIENQRFTAGVKELPDPNRILPQGDENATLQGVWTFSESGENFVLTIKEIEDIDGEKAISVAKRSTSGGLDWKVVCVYNGVDNYESGRFRNENSTDNSQALIAFDDESKFLTYQSPKTTIDGSIEYDTYTTIGWAELSETSNTTIQGRWQDAEGTLKYNIEKIGQNSIKFILLDEHGMDAHIDYYTFNDGKYVALGEEGDKVSEIVYADDSLKVTLSDETEFELTYWTNLTSEPKFASVTYEAKEGDTATQNCTVTVGNLTDNILYITVYRKTGESSKTLLIDGMFVKSTTGTDEWTGVNVIDNTDWKLTYSGKVNTDVVLETVTGTKTTYTFAVPTLSLFGTWLGLGVDGEKSARITISDETNGKIRVRVGGEIGGTCEDPIILEKQASSGEGETYTGTARAGASASPHDMDFTLTFINNVVKLVGIYSTSTSGEPDSFYSATCYEKDPDAVDPGTAINDLEKIWKTETTNADTYYIAVESASTTILSVKLLKMKYENNALKYDGYVSLRFVINKDYKPENENDKTTQYLCVSNGNTYSILVNDKTLKSLTYESKTYTYTKSENFPTAPATGIYKSTDSYVLEVKSSEGVTLNITFQVDNDEDEFARWTTYDVALVYNLDTQAYEGIVSAESLDAPTESIPFSVKVVNGSVTVKFGELELAMTKQ